MSREETTITEEKPEEAAAQAEATEATPDTPAESAEEETAEESSSEGGAPSLVARLRRLTPSLGGFGIGRLAAVLLFLGISAFAYHMVQQELVYEEPAPQPEFVPKSDDIADDLGAEELVTLGNGALESNDLDQASRFFEEARTRAELQNPDDVNLAVDVFNGLARIADQRGQPRVAELYREYVKGKQAELGDSLPLYSRAEQHFRAGEWLKARQGYARFLLTTSSLGPAGDRYIEMAKRRLAEIWEHEYRARAETPASILELAEPESYFDDVR